MNNKMREPSKSVIYLCIACIICLCGCTGLKVKIGAKLSLRSKDNLESAMNVRPVFTDVPKGWSSMFKQNMNEPWRKLNIKGINYFLLGKPGFLKGYVSRSDLNSKFYQAWFGVYIIQAKDRVFAIPNDKINESPYEGIMEYGKVAEHDQMAWLSAMGDPAPYAKSISYKPTIKINIDGNEVQLFDGVIESHSDLSHTETQLSNLLGMPKPDRWESQVDPFHDVTLKGIYGIWYNEKDKTIKIIYGCGAIVKQKNGEVIDHYSKLLDDLKIIAQNTTFVTLH